MMLIRVIRRRNCRVSFIHLQYVEFQGYVRARQSLPNLDYDGGGEGRNGLAGSCWCTVWISSEVQIHLVLRQFCETVW